MWRGGGAVRRDVQEGGDICMHVSDSLHHTAETQHCKVAISQFFLKKKEKKNKKEIIRQRNKHCKRDSIL